MRSFLHDAAAGTLLSAVSFLLTPPVTGKTIRDHRGAGSQPMVRDHRVTSRTPQGSIRLNSSKSGQSFGGTVTGNPG
jgi:hypothetical protein